MTTAQVLDVAREAIIVALKLGAPIMLLSLVIGLVISLFQALTQIQEQTLTFVPKLLITLVAILVLLPFMLATLSNFTESLMAHIVSG